MLKYSLRGEPQKGNAQKVTERSRKGDEQFVALCIGSAETNNIHSLDPLLRLPFSGPAKQSCSPDGLIFRSRASVGAPGVVPYLYYIILCDSIV